MRLVTDHDTADPSAHSAPIVSLIGRSASSSRGHHLRITW
jgi:hypothetical protein